MASTADDRLTLHCSSSAITNMPQTYHRVPFQSSLTEFNQFYIPDIQRFIITVNTSNIQALNNSTNCSCHFQADCQNRFSSIFHRNPFTSTNPVDDLSDKDFYLTQSERLGIPKNRPLKEILSLSYPNTVQTTTQPHMPVCPKCEFPYPHSLNLSKYVCQTQPVYLLTESPVYSCHTNIPKDSSGNLLNPCLSSNGLMSSSIPEQSSDLTTKRSQFNRSFSDSNRITRVPNYQRACRSNPSTPNKREVTSGEKHIPPLCCTPVNTNNGTCEDNDSCLPVFQVKQAVVKSNELTSMDFTVQTAASVANSKSPDLFDLSSDFTSGDDDDDDDVVFMGFEYHKHAHRRLAFAESTPVCTSSPVHSSPKDSRNLRVGKTVIDDQEYEHIVISSDESGCEQRFVLKDLTVTLDSLPNKPPHEAVYTGESTTHQSVPINPSTNDQLISPLITSPVEAYKSSILGRISRLVCMNQTLPEQVVQGDEILVDLQNLELIVDQKPLKELVGMSIMKRSKVLRLEHNLREATLRFNRRPNRSVPTRKSRRHLATKSNQSAVPVPLSTSKSPVAKNNVKRA